MEPAAKKVKTDVYQLLINNELVDGASTFDVINPATEEVLGQAPHPSAEQLEAAVVGAHQAWPEWASLSLNQRREHLQKAMDIFKANFDELKALLTAEQGKPLHMAEGELKGTIMLFEHAMTLDPVPEAYPETETHTVEVRRKPIGVVAGVCPWNFPVFCSLQKVFPALVLGNTFIWKPSPFTPLTAMLLAKLWKDTFPPGVLQVVSGNDKDAALNVGAVLSNHPLVNMVSFTGSVPTGKKIMACASNDVKRIVLEMGGNDAAILLPDIDVKETAPKVFFGAFMNTGQVCVAIKRCYVHESKHDEFVAALKEAAEAAKFGPGDQPGVEFGPLNNEMQFNKVMGFIDSVAKDGGKIVTGGKRMGTKGYFIEPTIVTGLKEGSKLVDEEQFGPVLPVIPYSSVDDVVARANRTTYGLGGSVWGKDVAKANEVAGRILSGTVWVNDHLSITGGPFGGFRQSGLGRELGASDLSAYTEVQTIQLAKI